MNTAFEVAKQQLQVAQHQFDQADRDHIDVAVYELKAAEERLNLVIREAKMSN